MRRPCLPIVLAVLPPAAEVWRRQPCKSTAFFFHYAGQVTAGATGMCVLSWLLPRGLCPATLQPPGEDSLEANCSVRGRGKLSETLWTVARWAPLSMGFSSQEYWSGLPFPSPGDLPNSRIKPRSPTLQADSLPTELLLQCLEWVWPYFSSYIT